MKEKVLFICTSNMTRSPTAEDLLRNSGRYEAKSAGTSEGAIVHISQSLVDWADHIIVMCEHSDGHATYLRTHFDLHGKDIIDLDIPDFIFSTRGDPGLVDLLKAKLAHHLKI